MTGIPSELISASSTVVFGTHNMAIADPNFQIVPVNTKRKCITVRNIGGGNLSLVANSTDTQTGIFAFILVQTVPITLTTTAAIWAAVGAVGGGISWAEESYNV